MSYRAYYKYKY